MNKAELINAISKETDLSNVAAGKTLDAVLSSITNALAAGDSVRLIGFGTFKVSVRRARTGRNPSTGAEIQIPARKAPTFIAGKALKEKVN